LFGKKRIEVPTGVLKPVLRKQTELLNIQIIAAALRGRLLDLRLFALRENVLNDSVARRKGWHVMPAALAEHVRLAARTYLIRGETRTLIPSLLAVRPNGLGSAERTKSPLLLSDEVACMWYMVPAFSSRHLTALCV